MLWPMVHGDAELQASSSTVARIVICVTCFPHCGNWHKLDPLYPTQTLDSDSES